MLCECVVCKQQAPCTQIKSTCSDNVLNYCSMCLSQRYESYDELVQYGFTFDMFSPSFRDKVVIPSLRYYNKSVDQFNKDVESRKEIKDGEQA